MNPELAPDAARVLAALHEESASRSRVESQHLSRALSAAAPARSTDFLRRFAPAHCVLARSLFLCPAMTRDAVVDAFRERWSHI